MKTQPKNRFYEITHEKVINNLFMGQWLGGILIFPGLPHRLGADHGVDQYLGLLERSGEAFHLLERGVGRAADAGIDKPIEGVLRRPAGGFAGVDIP